MNPRDSLIIEAISSGNNEKALEALYDTSFKKINNYVRKNSGSTEDAEDVFQDAILQLYRVVKAGKFDTRYDLDGFLFVVSKNLWINKSKRDQRILPISERMDIIGTNGNGLIQKERDLQIKKTFEMIGDKCKELLTLVVYFDHSMKDLCEKMGFPNENAAKTQHYKCKQKLIELVGANESFKQLLRDAV